MIRLHITAEGQTEERFVKGALANHLLAFGVLCDARCVLTSENKKTHTAYRGGFRRQEAYATVRKDITNWLKEECKNADCRFTTMFDYYALPLDFPGQSDAGKTSDPYEKVRILEEAFRKDIGSPHFIPYIQLHEFETLIFADPSQLDWEYLEHEKAISSLVGVADEFGNPELINNGPETAPSKRIISAMPEHGGNKTIGALIAQKIGIKTLKERCRHFKEWVETLETLDTSRRDVTCEGL